MKKERYIVECASDQIMLGISFAQKICKDQKIEKSVLVFPTKQMFEQSIVANFLGKKVSSSLIKGDFVNLIEDTAIRLAFGTNFRETYSDELVIAAHVSLAVMDNIDDSLARSIIFLPWSEQEGKEWVSTWGAITVGPDTWNVKVKNLAADAENEMIKLSKAVNLPNGLTHPLDKKRAKEVLRELMEKANIPDPHELRRWARRHGWSAKSSKELEDIVLRM